MLKVCNSKKKLVDWMLLERVNHFMLKYAFLPPWLFFLKPASYMHENHNRTRSH